MQHLVKSRLPGLVGLIGVAFAWTVPSGIVHAQAGSSIAGFDNICLTEARRAEAQHGIPEGLLQSISRVEAGRKTVTGEFMPWAWTLNDRGEGLFFDSREAAMRHLETAVAASEHSVDVGCMQVNTKWHMGGFHELGDMLDPVQNADYAAGFLLDLHEAHQSWDEAVKHYHSAKPEKNVVYHRRVLAELEMFLNGDHDDVAPAPMVIPIVVPDKSSEVKTASAPVAAPAPQLPDAPRIAGIGNGGTGLGSQTAPAKPVATDLAADVPARTSRPNKKQPNLAPHWDRVEHFRRLLAQEAG